MTRGETALHQDEKKTTSERDSLPKMLHLIHMTIYNVFSTSWTFANQKLFYPRPDPMLLLEISPIVGIVANYLCPVLGYLGEFLQAKAQIGWP